MDVLNSPVAPDLPGRWRAWLAPERQPLCLTAQEAAGLDLPTVPRADLRLSPEERDTLTLWAVAPGADRVAWLDRAGWAALDARQRRELLRLQVRHGRGNVPLGRHYADLLPELPPGRFLWSPEHLTPGVLARLLSVGQAACRRGAVPEAVWDAAREVLPGVRDLAGTFSRGSGNCFGAVMGAAGVAGAADEWTQRDPFGAFLAAWTRPARSRSGDRDARPGTVLVWRTSDGLAQHAAVTLGGGWAFQKASQSWTTPRVVLPVEELKRRNRTPGWRLERPTLSW